MKIGLLAAVLSLAGCVVDAQSAKSAFAPIPVSQRAALVARLAAYTEAFRKQDWSALYDLVSESDKNGLDGKPKVSRQVFIRDMHGTYDLRRLIKFTPVRTDAALLGEFDILGCGEMPYGDQKLERVSAVRAETDAHGRWDFVDWDFAEPPTPCAALADPKWKPQLPLKLDGPMSQVSCEILTCTL